jgi:hypothetical protein
MGPQFPFCGFFLDPGLGGFTSMATIAITA